MRAEIELALVADAQRARFFERKPPFGPWQEREDDRVSFDNPPSREQGTERPGRSFESASPMRHAIEPKTDPHRAAKHAFARQLAQWLEARAGGYGRLVVAAPPVFLGDLRQELGDAAQRRLLGTLDKDLTQLPLAEIAAQLDAIPRR